MTSRFVMLNGLRVALLLVFILSPSQALRALALAAMIATLIVDIIAYRRERELEEASDDDGQHVPLPPQYRDL